MRGYKEQETGNVGFSGQNLILLGNLTYAPNDRVGARRCINMTEIQELVKHVTGDIKHVHDDIEHVQRDIEEIGAHLKNLDEHMHNLIEHAETMQKEIV